MTPSAHFPLMKICFFLLIDICIAMHSFELTTSTMKITHSEKICLKWHDFQGNTEKIFKSLRSEPDFSDVTLVSKDNQHIKAHRVILSRSSPVFQSMLHSIEHTHPLIYMTGIESKYLSTLMDFIYNGEANIAEEDLQEFMNIAQELKVDGLKDKEQAEETKFTSILKSNEAFIFKFREFHGIKENQNQQIQEPEELTLPLKVETDIDSIVIQKEDYIKEECILISDKCKIHDLNERVSSMIEINSQGFNCTVCGLDLVKQRRSLLVNHIETKHMNLSFPCVQCQSSKSFNSRKGLSKHRGSQHSNGSL